MQITINENTRIVSDPRQYIVQTRHRREKPGKDGKLYSWRDRGYFSTLDYALQYLVEQFVRESEATEISVLRDELDAYKEELAAAVKDLREPPARTT